jgi:ABC-type transport system substrate-binding protein
LTIVDSGRIRLTCRSVALISVFLVSAFVTGLNVQPAKAPYPSITLYMVVNNSYGPGYYGGYVPIRDLIQTSLHDVLNINVVIVPYDEVQWESIIWTLPKCYQNGSAGRGGGKDGWDMTIFEWWVNPNNYLWIDEMAYSYNLLPQGWNIMSYNDSRADILYNKAQTTLDPAKHEQYMYKWQEEWMHNPPSIPLYYEDTYTARSSWVENYDETSWLYDLSQLDINDTTFNLYAPTARKNIGINTLLYGIVEKVQNAFPLVVWTYTEEQLNVMTRGMLYLNSRENLAYPSSGKFIVKPNIATKIPTASDWTQFTDTDGKSKWKVRIPIKSGLTWTDGVQFNATDVAFTYNTMLKIPDFTAYGDYSFLIDRVEVVDRYTVDFIYKPGMGPDYDFAGYNAHGWGLCMLPEHQMRGWTDYANWAHTTWNGPQGPIPASKGGTGLEQLGPYYVCDYSANQYVKLNRSDTWTHYTSTLGWPSASTLPQYCLLKFIPDDGTRILALDNCEVDMIEYPIADVATWQSMDGQPEHRVSTYSYPASHVLWFNNRNNIISNKYVRLAIAYAIPYDNIFAILPAWGVETAYPGKTFVTPWHDAFDGALGNYVYDPAKAQMYMDMYWNSQVGVDPTTHPGPFGDHNLDGVVDMLDYPVWVKNRGKTPSQWPKYPMNLIDPDNDNNGAVDILDFPYWAANVGKRYPYAGAW